MIRKHKTIRYASTGPRVVTQHTVAQAPSKPRRVSPRPTATLEPGWEALRSALTDAVSKEEVGSPFIAVLVPVLGRPHRVRSLVDSFEASTSSADARLYFVAQHSDHTELEAIRAADQKPILVGDDQQSWARKVNLGYAVTSEPWVLLGADDLAFRPGWVDVIRSLLRSHAGIIGTCDLGNAATIQGTHSTHPLVRRAYADHCGTVD